MHNLLPLLLVASLSTVLWSCSEQEKEVEEEIIIEKTIEGNEEPGLCHVVHFWLSEGLSDKDLGAFKGGLERLEAIPSVKRLWIGTPAATPSRGVVDNSFDYSLVVWFEDVAGHDVYQEHPIHLKFVEEHEAKFAKVRVRDTQY